MRRAAIILAIALFTLPAFGALTVVQRASSASGYNGTAPSATLSSTSAGNLLVAVVGYASSGTNVAITISGWTEAVSVNNGNATKVSILYLENCSAGITTVTASVPSAKWISMVVYEISGADTSSSLDKTATNTGASTSVSTGTTATTSQADEIAIGGAALSNQGLSSPLNSFTLTEITGSGLTLGGFDRIVSSTGTYSTGATSGGSVGWSSAIATFKAAPVVNSMMLASD